MTTSVQTGLIVGTTVYPARVECTVSPGIGIHLVGVRDNAAKEMLLRVITALTSYGYNIPGKKIIINISPFLAETVSTTQLDLPVAMALLSASGQIDTDFSHTMLFGELSLDGHLRNTPGCYALILDAIRNRNDIDTVVVPKADAAMVRDLADGITIFAADTLADVFVALRQRPEALLAQNLAATPSYRRPNYDFANRISVKELELLKAAAENGLDIILPDADSDHARDLARALSMLLAHRQDAKNIAAVYSIAQRPIPEDGFAPLQVAYPLTLPPALFGGGPNVSPGLLTLADGGVLLAKKICQWPPDRLKALVAAHLDRKVTITRLNSKMEMPANFSLVIQYGKHVCDERLSILGMLRRLPAIHITADFKNSEMANPIDLALCQAVLDKQFNIL